MPQAAATTGVNKIIKAGLRDWNILVGISQPYTTRSMYLLVYKFNSPPACSNATKKLNVGINDKIRAIMRSFSSLVKVGWVSVPVPACAGMTGAGVTNG